MRHTKTYHIVLGPPGWLTCLCEDDNSSTIYKAKLHNPIENIVIVTTNMNCQRVAFSGGLVYGLRNYLVYFYVFQI